MIGETIKFYRKLNNISQRSLAKSINKSNTFVSMVESGKLNISNNDLINIANALNIDVKLLRKSDVNINAELIELLIKLTDNNKIFWEYDDGDVLSEIELKDVYNQGSKELLEQTDALLASDDGVGYFYVDGYLTSPNDAGIEYFLGNKILFSDEDKYNRFQKETKDLKYELISRQFIIDSKKNIYKEKYIYIGSNQDLEYKDYINQLVESSQNNYRFNSDNFKTDDEKNILTQIIELKKQLDE